MNRERTGSGHAGDDRNGAAAKRHNEDLLYHGTFLQIRAMRRRNGTLPAKAWFDDLDPKDVVKLEVAAKMVETNLQLKRTVPGRLDMLDTDPRLLEIKVTRPGAGPPHLRMLGVRRENTLWIANGFSKQTNKLDARDIAEAVRITREWLDEN